MKTMIPNSSNGNAENFPSTGGVRKFSRLESNATILGPVDISLSPFTAPDGRRWIGVLETLPIPEGCRPFAVEVEDDRYAPEVKKGDHVVILPWVGLNGYKIALASPHEGLPFLVRIEHTRNGYQIYSMLDPTASAGPLSEADYRWVWPVYSVQRTLIPMDELGNRCDIEEDSTATGPLSGRRRRKGGLPKASGYGSES